MSNTCESESGQLPFAKFQYLILKALRLASRREGKTGQIRSTGRPFEKRVLPFIEGLDCFEG